MPTRRKRKCSEPRCCWHQGSKGRTSDGVRGWGAVPQNKRCLEDAVPGKPKKIGFLVHFERLVDFVGAHPQLSFLAVFLLALSEAVPVIGTVVRGSTLILAISALATTAGIKPWALLVAAVLGAIA
jgi:hypothetical protein